MLKGSLHFSKVSWNMCIVTYCQLLNYILYFLDCLLCQKSLHSIIENIYREFFFTNCACLLGRVRHMKGKSQNIIAYLFEWYNTYALSFITSHKIYRTQMYEKLYSSMTGKIEFYPRGPFEAQNTLLKCPWNAQNKIPFSG